MNIWSVCSHDDDDDGNQFVATSTNHYFALKSIADFLRWDLVVHIQCLLSSLLFLHLVHLSLFNNPPSYTIKALRNNCPFWIIYQNVDQSSAWCLFHVKLLFSLDLGGLHICQRRLSQKIRPFLFAHSHTLTHGCTQSYSCCCWEKICRVFWGPLSHNVGKERKQ